MKQKLFEDQHQAEWESFAWRLELLEKPRRKIPAEPAVSHAAFPAAYRRICAHLALARERQYSSRLCDYLGQLTLRGYQQLYRAPQSRLANLLQFIAADFPRLVRAEAGLFWLCSVLFYLPLLAMGWAVYDAPELIYSLLSHDTVAEFETLYQPGHGLTAERKTESDVLMFGHYIHNNIGIGFRTFAAGILFAVGTVFILVFNGVFIGAIAGYLTDRGYADTFYPFVIGHGAFELTGIVLAGVAGMKLGLALIAPGRHPRLQALRIAAATSIKIVYGVIALLLLAAFVEAFWSSKHALPDAVRYTVGAGCWLLVASYFLGAGRRAA